MNFSLSQLESEVPENDLLQAEALLEEGRITPPQEVDKGLWVAYADGLEVEVRLAGKKVAEGTCECDAFATAGSCEHLVGTLLILRRQEQDKARRKERRKKASGRPSRLTTGVVLDNIDFNELAEFVRDYARNNRSFAIALKARFAASVDSLDTRKKYEQLLDSTISAARSSDREITTRGSQKLLKVLEELHQQMEAALAGGDYLEASVIARILIEKVSPLLRKISGKKAEILAYVHKAFEALQLMLEQPLAPRLREQLWKYAVHEHHKLTYRSQQIDLLFFKWMARLAQEPAELQTLLDMLARQSEKYEEEGRPGAPLLLQRVSTLEKAGREEEARQLMERNLTQPDLLEYAIRQAQKRGQRPRLKALAQTGLKLGPPAGIRSRLEQLLLDMALEENDPENIQAYALLRFYDSLDLAFYKIAKEASPPERWKEQVTEILQQLRKQSYSPKLRDTQASILALEEEWELLMAYAEEVQSLDLLQQVDELLLPRFPARLMNTYRSLILEYAKHHLGRQTSRRIRLALDRLLEIGAQELVHELLSYFTEHYGERHTLMEELNGLLSG